MSQINLYFPTPIYVEEAIVSVDENIKWADKIIQMQDSITSGGKTWEGNTYTTHGTFDLTNDETFSPLIDIISKHVQNFTNEHSSTYVHTCNSAWGNVNTQGTFQEYHSHPASVFSCVYYPKVPSGSGNIVFESPLVPDMMPVKNFKQLNDLTQDRIDYQPKEGMLLIFRSYLRHCVQSGTNTDPRVSISLNFG